MLSTHMAAASLMGLLGVGRAVVVDIVSFLAAGRAPADRL
jgi:hypothetical protein